jgi:threonine dehydrogenase-like Zn-dependent dehydrogenase
MRYAVYDSPYKIVIKHGDNPEIKTPQDILIRVCYVGICGDDIPFFLMDDSLMTLPFPEAIVGHEFSGIIEDLGEDAAQNGFKKGDFVSGLAWSYCGVCDNCKSGYENHCTSMRCTSVLADYIVMNQRQVVVIPPDIGLQNATFTDPVSYALYNCLKKMRPERFNNVLIFGSDAMAMIMLQITKRFGAVRVVMVDTDHSKLKLSKSLGADEVVDYSESGFISAALKLSQHKGYDLVFEMSRNLNMIRVASQVVGVKGTILYSYMYDFDAISNISLMELYLKEAELHPFFLSGNLLPQTVRMMQSIELSPLVGRIYPFERINEAFNAHLTNQYVKILIDLQQ